MTDDEARDRATMLAARQVPPYVLTRCDCRGGQVVLKNLNSPTGQTVKPCTLCDGTMATWTTAPGTNAPCFSDRKLIEHLGSQPAA